MLGLLSPPLFLSGTAHWRSALFFPSFFSLATRRTVRPSDQGRPTGDVLLFFFAGTTHVVEGRRPFLLFPCSPETMHQRISPTREGTRFKWRVLRLQGRRDGEPGLFFSFFPLIRVLRRRGRRRFGPWAAFIFLFPAHTGQAGSGSLPFFFLRLPGQRG